VRSSWPVDGLCSLEQARDDCQMSCLGSKTRLSRMHFVMLLKAARCLQGSAWGKEEAYKVAKLGSEASTGPAER
jgi:hypothetical protein